MKKAKEFYLKAVEERHTNAMNNLAYLYFQQKKNKERAIQLSERAVNKEKSNACNLTLTVLYLWNNQIDDAVKIIDNLIKEKEFIDKYSDDFQEVIQLLIAKKGYKQATTYFSNTDLKIKDRYKPLYYAFLKITDNKDYEKMSPEIEETVNEIIETINQMAIDYA